jgi:transcriptional regulator with XRE-family HTH domain
MTKHALLDRQVAKKIGVSRVQVSRIRRGITGASVKTSMRLQELTGHRWWHFLGQDQKPKRGKRGKRGKRR